MSRNPRINIQVFEPQYKDQILDLILEIQVNEFGIAITAEDQPDLSAIADVYQTGRGNFWIALEENHVVGTIALIDIGDGNGALRKMFVHKDYRGAQLKIGQQLLDTLLAWCRHQVIGQIYLGTTSAYLAAHRFYEKNGFRQIEKKMLPSSFPVMPVDSKFFYYAVV